MASNKREITTKKSLHQIDRATELQLEKLVHELIYTECMEHWVPVIKQLLLRLSGSGGRRNGIALAYFVMMISPIITSGPMEMPYHTRARGRVCVIRIRC